MKIAVLNASSQKEKNGILYEKAVEATEKLRHTVRNLGVFPQEKEAYSYIQMALCVSVLLTSRAADFVITGCSSGTGMMLACNSLPGVLCGYLSNPAEAFLFGRINGGNAASLPLGLYYGWAGELNLGYTLEKLFEGPMGVGYPPGDAERKQRDTALLKKIKRLSHVPLLGLLGKLDRELVQSVLAREPYHAYLLEHSRDADITSFVRACV